MKKDKTAYTPMIQQYLQIKEDYPESIVFFRLGDFYEMFFEDAVLASRELEIQLTARDGGSSERIPMCGVPHHSSESYIARLVEKGYKIAICEQTEEPAKGKKLVARDVVRVVTPGTNIDDSNAEEHDIAALGITDYFYTVAHMNVSTGELYALKVPKDDNALISELATLSLKEIVISHVFLKDVIETYAAHEGITISLHPSTEIDDTFKHLYEALPTPQEQTTLKRLLSYIMKTQKRTLLHLKPVKKLKASGFMKLDANTIRHLELTRTMLKNMENGSLYWLLNFTQTAMGGRFLKRQMLRPLINKEVLNKRYDFVGRLNQEFITASELSELLKNVYDLERIVGRISYGNINAKDLVQLRASISVLPQFKQLLSDLDLTYAHTLSERINALRTVHETLERALKDDVPLSVREGGMIKEGYDETLDELRDVHLNISQWLQDLQESERERTGIKNLKVGYNRVFGYYIEVPKGQVKHVKESFGYNRKQTLANAERYITEALKEKEKIILSSEEKSIEREYELFRELKDMAKNHIQTLQHNAEIISEIDMYLAFSRASERYNLSRPTLIDDHRIEIKESRHPIVERMMEESFIANDIVMDDSTDVFLITGPNMSGKSTYMRQLAITTVMAQIGCFVPAKEAKLKLFDALFTRIGASDDLISGKSTFMVEMLEANNAIKHATKDSLILFDEIGRGTSTYDGMAIAQAIIEYIHETIGAKTMFSTHYHELTDLEDTLTRLKNIHVAASEEDGEIIFHHQVKEGRADKSYGINVAQLAHLPKPLIRRSKTILKHLENGNQAPTHATMDLFDYAAYEAETPNEHQALIATIESLDLDSMKPIDALFKLYELKKTIKDKT